MAEKKARFRRRVSEVMLHCTKPDKDFPRLECGHPLPCPWHTVTVDTTATPPTITEPTTGYVVRRQRLRLRKIAQAFAPE